MIHYQSNVNEMIKEYKNIQLARHAAINLITIIKNSKGSQILDMILKIYHGYPKKLYM